MKKFNFTLLVFLFVTWNTYQLSGQNDCPPSAFPQDIGMFDIHLCYNQNVNYPLTLSRKQVFHKRGDLHKGIMGENLIAFYEKVFKLSNKNNNAIWFLTEIRNTTNFNSHSRKWRLLFSSVSKLETMLC